MVAKDSCSDVGRRIARSSWQRQSLWCEWAHQRIDCGRRFAQASRSDCVSAACVDEESAYDGRRSSEIKHQKSDQLGVTAQMLGLTGTERKLLPSLGTGQGLWKIKEMSFLVQAQLHPDELTAFDTRSRML